MRASRLIAAAALAATTAVPLTAPAVAAPAQGSSAGGSSPTFAVIGDVPYGDEQIAAFPGWIDDINAGHPNFTVHVGDIKNGSSPCTDQYFSMIKTQFDRIDRALVYTPGDNEWTDCHRVAAGSYNPLERLATVRQTFFAKPRQTLGQKPISVRAQVKRGLPENVAFRRHHVSFATLHVVGSNNDLAPWSGLGLTEPTAAQLAEQRTRMTGAIEHVREVFAQARERGDRAVVLMQQADMFSPEGEPVWSSISAFKRLVQVIAQESGRFDGEVYLFDGDTHVFNVDRPLASGSSWLDVYGAEPADNLTRITVDGEEQNTNWLRVAITPAGSEQVLTWERVPYTS